MSLKYLIQSKRQEFSFNDINELLQLSEGYTRQLIADMIRKNILKPDKKKKDKRFVVYSLDWSSIREYLLSDPSDFEEIILSLVEEQHLGKYVAIDNFEVKYFADTLMELTNMLDFNETESTVFVTSAGIPKNQIILELS